MSSPPCYIAVKLIIMSCKSAEFRRFAPLPAVAGNTDLRVLTNVRDEYFRTLATAVLSLRTLNRKDEPVQTLGGSPD
jgi:hypothetical protein